MQKEEAVVLITSSFITPTSNNPTFQSNIELLGLWIVVNTYEQFIDDII
jgi:hypothetical protein